MISISVSVVNGFKIAKRFVLNLPMNLFDCISTGCAAICSSELSGFVGNGL